MDNKTDQVRDPATPKKPYQKPEFRHERVFETRALNCGKTGTEGQCQHNRRAS